jgi:hypothetical protein
MTMPICDIPIFRMRRKQPLRGGFGNHRAFRGCIKYLRAAIMIVGLMICAGCALVDNGIPSRNDPLNHGYDIANNDEILLNIVRAKHFQPLRFYLHSKIAPSQTTSASLGLPNITFGPAQTVAQHQFVFGPNSTSNMASMSYELDPLETQAFYNGIVGPISWNIIISLLSRYPREVLYFALFEGVRITETSPYTTVTEYKNDPGTDNPASCPDFDYSNYDRLAFNPSVQDVSVYNPAYESSIGISHSNCNFHKFQFYVEEAIKYGLVVTSTMVPNPNYNPNDSKSTQPKQIAQGGVCFDLALARPDVVGMLSTLSDSLCEKQGKKTAAARIATKKKNSTTMATPTTPVGGSATTPLQFAYGPHIVKQTVEIVPRSTAGVFAYLGRLLAFSNVGRFVKLYSVDASANGDRRLFTAVRTAVNILPECFAAANLFGDQYCIPIAGTDNTKRMFQLLSELIALDSSANDVPTSLTVRVTP